MNDLIAQTFKIMGMGMGTVFFVLFLFYFMVRLLTKVFPYREETAENGGQEK